MWKAVEKRGKRKEEKRKEGACESGESGIQAEEDGREMPDRCGGVECEPNVLFSCEM